MAFRDPEEVLDFIYALLDTNKVSLGVKFIGYGDETLIPEYPAVILTSDPVQRDIHATRQFMVTFNCSLWVYHARLDENHKTRTRNDLLLATSIRELLHDNKNLGGNIIFGYVNGETPGVLTRPNELIIGTRITWEGNSIVHFDI